MWLFPGGSLYQCRPGIELMKILMGNESEKLTELWVRSPFCLLCDIRFFKTANDQNSLTNWSISAFKSLSVNVNKPNTNIKITVSSLTQAKSIKHHLVFFSPGDAPRGQRLAKTMEARWWKPVSGGQLSAGV